MRSTVSHKTAKNEAVMRKDLHIFILVVRKLIVKNFSF